MAPTLESFTDKNGFLDVPSIISAGKQQEFFPGLLPNVTEIRARDFPLLDQTGRAYLDSTATSQEPDSVKDRMHQHRKSYLRGSNHSKNNAEARRAQEEYVEAKAKLINFFHASNYHLAFTSGTTGSSNLVATRFRFTPYDLFLYTEGEHNSQIITARNFARQAGSQVEIVRVHAEDGRLDLDHLGEIVGKAQKRRFVMNLVHSSNVSGVVNPVVDVKKILGSRGVIYLDVAQSAGHLPLDFDTFDVDFLGMSAHKMYGPTGIGAIFVNHRSQGYLTNCISGGSAVETNSRELAFPSATPERLEPGTQDLEGAVEWGMAVDYLSSLGMSKVHAHDTQLAKYFLTELSKIPGVRVYGPKTFENRLGVVTFNLGSILARNYDTVAQALDQKGISVRDGCFCTHILTSKLLGIPDDWHEERVREMDQGVTKGDKKLLGAVRASFAFYNTLEEAYRAVQAVGEIAKTMPVNRR